MGVVLMWIWILVRYDTYPYDTNTVCCDNLCSSLLIYFRLLGLPRNCTQRTDAKHGLTHLNGWFALFQRVLRMRADGLEGVGRILGIC